LRSLKRHAARRQETASVRVVGIDDWSWRQGTTYGTILVDLESRTMGSVGAKALCANDDETPAPFEFRLGHRRMTSWLCPTQMAQSN
jgi:hypothetical protein